MKEIISFNFAGKTLAAFLSLLLIFHLLVLFGILPSDIVWGSQLTNKEMLIYMETTSLAVTIVFLSNTIIYIKDKSNPTFRKLARVLLWFMACYFLLNTINNILSENNLETLIFTPISIILAFLSFRLALEK